MRTVYRLLLRLYPARIRREFGDEMLDVFDQASADASLQGAGAYLRFCLREIAGMFVSAVVRDNLIRHRRWILQGMIAGMLLAGVTAAAIASRPFVSTATVRVLPPMIPERFVASQPAPDLDLMLDHLVEGVVSRTTLQGLIASHNLYPELQARMPVEDIVEIMRKDVTVGTTGTAHRMIRVSFQYSDRVEAQKVAADLMSRLMTEFVRERTTRSVLTTQFLKDQAELASYHWENALTTLQDAENAGKPTARARLDVEIERQRYEAMRRRFAEAETAEQMEKRQQGVTMELFEPASLPPFQYPMPALVAMWSGWGGLAGGFLGWLVSALLARRRENLVTQAEL